MVEFGEVPLTENCARCWKTPSLCLCDAITPLATRHRVLLLQHPQEPDKVLGTARITHLSLPNSVLRVGLSWPNLRTALGEEAVAQRWVVLYLGSVEMPREARDPLVYVDKKGSVIAAPPPSDIDGLIVLDGTWSQAKALWWRNAWLLKCRRAVLRPAQKSLYGRMRKEPRRECLSTIESVGLALTGLGEPESVELGLRQTFSALLARAQRRPGPAAPVAPEVE
jgi:DTW domain-containing protein YfiP